MGSWEISTARMAAILLADNGERVWLLVEIRLDEKVDLVQLTTTDPAEHLNKRFTNGQRRT
ncbi:hypothetical protein SAMN05192559_11031 [Halobacillus karajensis]|uniref:Uncharacterized protein n=1 Tax=Halobacillus karajensis TaxID=195088 RepID=A0A024PAA0_9BACI|nr:hypothetical protein [Halobacillus karajensis]CDQ21412.1 hypothetical protein BN982_03798 [Halobacillus karajensis]CDQ25347.1 hypothetical protein BN983_03678 [Halobacillus karajensis]CDQ29671.1 hypothetical protein BN981_04092 [Halobacillus karajensis]SEI07355.1 hypothetical protein SAMN05192559_11031 [Halobacillus karajensis]